MAERRRRRVSAPRIPGCIPQGFVGSGPDAAGSSFEELTLFHRRLERFARYRLAHCTGCGAACRTIASGAASAVGQLIPPEPFDAATEKGQLFTTRPCSISTRPDKTLRYASRGIRRLSYDSEPVNESRRGLSGRGFHYSEHVRSRSSLPRASSRIKCSPRFCPASFAATYNSPTGFWRRRCKNVQVIIKLECGPLPAT